MRGLLEKDFRLLLIRKSTLVIFLIIGVVFTWEFSGSVSGAYLTMLGTLLSLSTLSYDDADNCMSFIFTLPCTRREYVKEKYLFVYGISFIAGVIGIVIIVAASLMKGVPVGVGLIAETLASELPILVITGGLMIPLQLKFGPEKSRIVLMGIIGVILVGGYMIGNAIGGEEGLAGMVAVLDAMQPAVVFGVLMVVLCIITVISYMISVKTMEQKEY